MICVLYACIKRPEKALSKYNKKCHRQLCTVDFVYVIQHANYFSASSIVERASLILDSLFSIIQVHLCLNAHQQRSVICSWLLVHFMSTWLVYMCD
jgi:hypothetical protein